MVHCVYQLTTGLSPDLQSMEQIRRIMRPTDVPDQGLLCDLLWSDPDKETMGWGENDRGVSFTFGAEVVAKFLHKHDLDLICRAHQVTISLSLSSVVMSLRRTSTVDIPRNFHGTLQILKPILWLYDSAEKTPSFPIFVKRH